MNSANTNQPDSKTRHSSALWWMVPAATFIVLMVVAMFIGSEAEKSGTQSSYDATASGVRAAYLLLEDLDYPVTRSKRPTGGAVKWLLFPTYADKDVDVLARWVKDGGTIVLATDSEDFAKAFGLNLNIDTIAAASPEPITGLGVQQIAGCRTRVRWTDTPGKAIVTVTKSDEPIVTIHPFGKGEIWLINRPEFLTNEWIAQADNAILVCRLADAVMEGKTGKLAFDEYFHGMRDRPGVTELLLQSPIVWVTAQGLILAGVMLWHFVPRFGNVRPERPRTRRSRAEFLDAMAALLERKRDYRDAYGSVLNGMLHAFTHELGLPPATPPEMIAAEASRRRGVDAAALMRLVRNAPDTSSDFLRAVQKVEDIRSQFLQKPKTKSGQSPSSPLVISGS